MYLLYLQTMGFVLVDKVQGRAVDLQSKAKNLSQTVTQALSAYEQLQMGSM
jgi:hypothetical protein